MAKDKAVDAVIKGAMEGAEIRKALCTVTVFTYGEEETLEVKFEDVAGYQLLEGVLIILRHEGPTHLIPTTSFDHVAIESNKE